MHLPRIFRREEPDRKDQPSLLGLSAPGRRPGKTRFPYVPLKESFVSRRSFLARSLAWTTAAIGASLAAIGLGAIGAPALRKNPNQWSPIGRPGDPGPGEPDLATVDEPLLTSFTSLVQDAYMAAAPQHVPVFVLNEGDKYTIFDVRCTHLGCPVSWDDKTQKFYSPCHGGVFSKQGEVLAGPPPRPLDQYEVKFEDGVLYAGALYRVTS